MVLHFLIPQTTKEEESQASGKLTTCLYSMRGATPLLGRQLLLLLTQTVGRLGAGGSSILPQKQCLEVLSPQTYFTKMDLKCVNVRKWASPVLAHHPFRHLFCWEIFRRLILQDEGEPCFGDLFKNHVQCSTSSLSWRGL